MTFLAQEDFDRCGTELLPEFVERELCGRTLGVRESATVLATTTGVRA